MRKLLVAFCLFIMVKAQADEGMWLPYLLGEKVYQDMVKKGLKLSKEQLYSINKASMKDAIVIFGGGCTGEIVSAEGLIFTNHHCGYGSIADASSVEHNYLRDGFWASDKSKEIPAKGLSVQFLVRVDDVTDQVETALSGLKGLDRAKKQAEIAVQIEKKAAEGTNYEAKVVPMYKANQFLLFVYERYNDVRLVGAPPESVGKYGGDTDNWEWPRHTADFSVFRVYTDKNGKASDYSASNIPMKSKYFLPVSLKGLSEGDYAMILGYPGGTNRYETSYGVQLSTDINNPSLVALRDMRLKFMKEQMKSDPAIKLQLASRYAGVANYWKFFDGETKQLLKHGVYEQKKKSEEEFNQWAKGKPEFENIFRDYANAYDAWRPYAKERVYLNEGILGSTLTAFTYRLSEMENALSRGQNVTDLAERVNATRKDFLTGFNKPSEQNIVAQATKMFYTDIPKDQQPTEFYQNLQKQFGSLDDDATYQKFAAYVFSNTIILDDAKWNEFIKNPSAATLQNDPAFNYVAAFGRNYSKYAPLYVEFTNKNNELGRLYLKGVLQKEPNATRYPDANFTMRLSYGKVQSYSPRDAVEYDYATTIQGVLEKYVPGDYEYNLPSKLIELEKKNDYGQYIDAKRKTLVTDFITTNDITGGNSGSPVLNGKGELIGLAFDGNYEALSHKMAFDSELNRTICVDIRYVLWCIDKLGGGENIIKELKIVK